jgi:hypothetical protein
MIEATLHKLAEHILGLDEASLVSLWEKYKLRAENFDTSREWEKAVIIFLIINAVQAKNQIFNEEIQKQLQKQTDSVRTEKRPHGKRSSMLIKPDLRRVK